MISIVIVSYRSSGVLRDCLAKLIPQLSREDEVIVVENSNDDELENWKEFRSENVNLIINPTNNGYSAGCNQGIKIVRNHWVLLLNPDTIPTHRALHTLTNELRGAKQENIFAVELLNADGTRQSYYRRFPNVRALVAMFFLPPHLQSKSRAYCKYTYANDFEIRASFEQPPGAGLVIPKTKLLDEDFFLYGSDLMLCWEHVHKTGTEIELLATQFYHLRGQGGTNSSPELIDWLRVESAKGFVEYFAKTNQHLRLHFWKKSYLSFEVLAFVAKLWIPSERLRRIKRIKSFLS
jgi:GT2 family glycosyltransferase